MRGDENDNIGTKGISQMMNTKMGGDFQLIVIESMVALLFLLTMLFLVALLFVVVLIFWLHCFFGCAAFSQNY